MSHKRLRQYSVVVDGKLSKIVEFSKGEAELFARNFIECRLTHSVVKATAGIGNIKAYFSDVTTIKSQLETKINAMTSQINKIITNATSSIGSIGSDEANTLTETQRNVLNYAKEQLAEAKKNISSVVDDSDFNKENINEAKGYVSDAIDELINNGFRILGTSSSSTGHGNNDDASTTMNLSEEKRSLNTDLNRLRKWQLDVFEEEYSAEIFAVTYHDYLYAKTFAELCEKINKALKSLGAAGEINANSYRRENNEMIRNRTEQEQNMIVYGKPVTGQPNYYYVVSESSSEPDVVPTTTIYRWINGKYVEWGNTDLNIINVEDDIKMELAQANIEFKRIDVDWQDKNYDPDADAFIYSG